MNNMEIISGIIDRIENKKLIIKINGARELTVPTATGKWREGDAIKLVLLKDDKINVERQDLAKQILNELLSGAEWQHCLAMLSFWAKSQRDGVEGSLNYGKL